MKLELGPDLEELRERARQRVADAVERSMPSPAQAANYALKKDAARQYLHGKRSFLERMGLRDRRLPSLLQAEAMLRDFTPVELAELVLARAEAHEQRCNEIELHRVDFAIKLVNANSEREIQTLEAEMMQKLATLGATT